MPPFQPKSGQIAYNYKNEVINSNESIENTTQESHDSNRLNRVRSLNFPSSKTIKTECSNKIESDSEKKLPQSTCVGINIHQTTAKDDEERLKKRISFRQSSARCLTSDS